MLFVKNNPKKILESFFLFWNPNHEWTHENNGNKVPTQIYCLLVLHAFP